MRSKLFSTLAAGIALSACAGRDPAPVASVQPQDVYADCTMIRAEIEANNAKAKELTDEQGWKVAQSRHRSGRVSDLAGLVRDGLEGHRRQGCRRIAGALAIPHNACRTALCAWI